MIQKIFQYLYRFILIIVLSLNIFVLAKINSSTKTTSYYANKINLINSLKNYLYIQNNLLLQKEISIPSSSCVVVKSKMLNTNLNNQTLLTPASGQKIFTALAVIKFLKEKNIPLNESLYTDAFITPDNNLYIQGSYDPLISTAEYRTKLEKTSRLNNLQTSHIEDLISQIQKQNMTIKNIYVEQQFNERIQWQKTETDYVGRLSKLNINGGIENINSGKLSQNPSIEFGNILKQKLNLDVNIQTYNNSSKPVNMKKIASLKSVSFFNLISEMLTQSDNLTAELLLNYVLEQKNFSAVEELYNHYKINPNAISVDASGLSPINKSTCLNMINSFNELKNLLKEHNENEYLAISGESGTLSKRLTQTLTKGKIVAKTGSIKNVSLLVGKILDTKITFAIIVNQTLPDVTLKQLVDSITATITTIGDNINIIQSLKVSE